VIDFAELLLIVMDLPTTNDQYAMKDYWDRRYMEEVAYDWFARYELFAHHITRTINRSDRILQLGIGLSVNFYVLKNETFVTYQPFCVVVMFETRVDVESGI